MFLSQVLSPDGSCCDAVAGCLRDVREPACRRVRQAIARTVRRGRSSVRTRCRNSCATPEANCIVARRNDGYRRDARFNWSTERPSLLLTLPRTRPSIRSPTVRNRDWDFRCCVPWRCFLDKADLAGHWSGARTGRRAVLRRGIGRGLTVASGLERAAAGRRSRG